MPLNETEASEFLARVLPWPEEGRVEGYCNVHWTEPRQDDPVKPWWTGRAARTPDELLSTLRWVAGLGRAQNFYICMSRQRDTQEKLSQRGYPYFHAMRSSIAALAFKGLYLDLDFKQYPDSHAATEALKQFLHATGLPRPSAIVMTGGGMHLHWTCDHLLQPNTWYDLAAALVAAVHKHGLRCDTACTIDAARILRVPGTLNYKYDPPRPVVLMHCATFDYPLERLSKPLAPYVGLTPQRSAAVIAFPLPPRPPLQEPSDLAAGIESPLLSWKPMAKECGFIRHALRTGGRDYANPLWHLATLVSTFAGGQGLAHLMSSSHADYSVEETDQLYERKLRERRERGIGWPSCRAISQAGCNSCATCQHFVKQKSPLHLAHPDQPGLIGSADLPAGYIRNAEGRIVEVTRNEDGDEVYELVSTQLILDAYITEGAEGWVFHFVAELGVHTRTLKLPGGQMSVSEMPKVLQRQGYFSNSWKPLWRFVVAWAKRLQEIKDQIINASSFGWVTDDQNRFLGFAYGGILTTPTGSQQVPHASSTLAGDYKPVGEQGPWTTAAKLITDQGRPSLDVILASAFAAPLVALTEHSGLLISAYSPQSGIGKTTAIKVAQTVWGSPKAVSNLNDTENFIDKKLRELHSIPVYWDEMHTNDDGNIGSFFFRISSGRGRARLNRSAEMTAEGGWKTMLVAASNRSLIENSMHRAMPAALMRLFEFQVPPPDPSSQLESWQASDIIRPLERNYGVVGARYAEWLGKNHKTIEQDIATLVPPMVKLLGPAEDRGSERFWLATVVLLVLGARYANRLGFTQFDEPALQEFLIGCVARMRDVRSVQGVDFANPMKVSTIFNEFLEDSRPHTVYSDKLPGPGRPAVATAPQTTIPAMPTQNARYYVQRGRKDNACLIRRSYLEDWLFERKHAPGEFVRALKQLGNARYVQGVFGRDVNQMMPIETGLPETLLRVDMNALERHTAVDFNQSMPQDVQAT